MDLALKFKEIYGQEPLITRSPGRINLIGEHTDYNGGLVMPAAIGQEICLGIAKNGGTDIRLSSLDLQQSIKVPFHEVKPQSEATWANFILGVVHELQLRGVQLAGFDCAFKGDIPLGAGLSSSAALECATAFALNTLFDLDLDRLTMVQIAQKAENNFVGVQCGMMDQFASMFGKSGQVIQLDCRSLAYTYAPLNLQGYKIILLDSQVKHSLADTEYNTRRQECEAGVNFLAKFYPEIKNLRDVNLSMLEKHQSEMDPVIYKRCQFVVLENKRVEATAEALRAGDLHQVGKLLYASHEGLQNDYEVSCPELDFLVEKSKAYDFVLGARMMGGGFGGCTINLVAEDEAESWSKQMLEAYQSELDLALKVYPCHISQGTSLVDSL